MAYVGLGKRGARRVAGANTVSRLGQLRGSGLARLGDGVDWSTFLPTLVNDAASVATVAVRPPTYSSVTGPYGTSVTSYGSPGVAGTSSASGLSSLFSPTSIGSPIFLLGGALLLIVVLMKR